MSRVGIIGGGPAGLMCAIIAKRQNPDLDITIFEKNDIASTILSTGGGRCNISHLGDDIKAFAQNYPRGEKFLYSVFSTFFIPETIEFFESLGIVLYTQADGRMFPKSNKSLDVIFALKNEIKRLNISIQNKEVKNFQINGGKFVIDSLGFDKIVIATGGKSCELLNQLSLLGINIIKQTPALASLEIKEKFLSALSGVSLRNVSARASINKKEIKISADLLFTHKGISGPLVYQISSLFARENYSGQNPVKILLNFAGENDIALQKKFDENPQKDILNLLTMYIPKSLAAALLEQSNIPHETKCHQINKQSRIAIKKFLTAFEINAISSLKGGEIVSAGGVDLKEVNPKTMESKKIEGMYFCGEVLDIDGFCGGYNL